MECVLAVSPELPVPYHTEEMQERLMELYRYLHSRLHHPTRPLRSIYRCTNTENLLAWVRICACVHKHARALIHRHLSQRQHTTETHLIHIPHAHTSHMHRIHTYTSQYDATTIVVHAHHDGFFNPSSPSVHQRLRALPLLHSSGHQSCGHVGCHQTAEVDQEGGGPSVYPQFTHVLIPDTSSHLKP